MDTVNVIVRALHVVFVIGLVGGIAPSHMAAATARRIGDPKMALGIWTAWLRMGSLSAAAALGMIVTGVTLSFTMRYGLFPAGHVWLAMKQAISCVALVVVAMMLAPVQRAEKAVSEALRTNGELSDELRTTLQKPANLGRILDALAVANLVIALWRPGS